VADDLADFSGKSTSPGLPADPKADDALAKAVDPPKEQSVPFGQGPRDQPSSSVDARLVSALKRYQGELQTYLDGWTGSSDLTAKLHEIQDSADRARARQDVDWADCRIDLDVSLGDTLEPLGHLRPVAEDEAAMCVDLITRARAALAASEGALEHTLDSHLTQLDALLQKVNDRCLKGMKGRLGRLQRAVENIEARLDAARRLRGRTEEQRPQPERILGTAVPGGTAGPKVEQQPGDAGGRPSGGKDGEKGLKQQGSAIDLMW
jgi:hypothetical protein